MKEFITEKMLHDIITAMTKGEVYKYSDENTELNIGPNSLSIHYKSLPTEVSKEREIDRFLKFCDSIDDELFMEVCDTFDEGELNNLQDTLDTDNYRNTIEVFTARLKEVANNKLEEICNAADSEIRRQEQIIANARKEISEIHKQLDEAQKKYSI